MKRYCALLFLMGLVLMPTFALAQTHAEAGRHSRYLPLVRKAEVPLTNGSFEEGPDVGWRVVFGTVPVSAFIRRATQETGPAYHGQWLLALGGASDVHERIIQEGFTVPADKPYLTFWYRASTTEPDCSEPYRNAMSVMIDAESASIIMGGFDLCEYATRTGWQRFRYPLHNYVGPNARLSFEIHTDSEYPATMYVDYIEFTR